MTLSRAIWADLCRQSGRHIGDACSIPGVCSIASVSCVQTREQPKISRRRYHPGRSIRRPLSTTPMTTSYPPKASSRKHLQPSTCASPWCRVAQFTMGRRAQPQPHSRGRDRPAPAHAHATPAQRAGRARLPQRNNKPFLLPSFVTTLRDPGPSSRREHRRRRRRCRREAFPCCLPPSPTARAANESTAP